MPSPLRCVTPRERRRRSALGMVVAVALFGCERPPGARENDTVAIALALPAGAAITAVAWTVLSSSNQMLASGTVDASGLGASPSFGVELPAGTGDILEMTATTALGATCSGTSAPFDVVSGRVALVAIALLCTMAAPDASAGDLTVTGALVPGDTCPEIDAWSMAADEGSSGGTPIVVSISATDPDDGDVLTFAWNATAGSFKDPAAPSTDYACGPPGTATVSVAISDNHAPTPCVLEVSFPDVTCF